MQFKYVEFYSLLFQKKNALHFLKNTEIKVERNEINLHRLLGISVLY